MASKPVLEADTLLPVGVSYLSPRLGLGEREYLPPLFRPLPG